MEYINIILGTLSLLLSIVLIVMFLKNKNEKSSLSEKDLKNIRESVSESIKSLSDSISNLVAIKNDAIIKENNQKYEEVTKKINELEESFDLFVKTNSDFRELVNKEINSLEKLFIDYKNEFTKINNEHYNDLSERFNTFKNNYVQDHNAQKDELMNKLEHEIKEFKENVNNTLSEFNKSIKEKLTEVKEETKESIKSLSENVSKNLSEIRKDNSEKLSQINDSVNEKLQKTLEEKLDESFKTVLTNINSVNNAIHEIKGIANDVGSLKNILTNVKTKGIMGEVILGNIIKEFLTCGQYEENVVTKKGSSERVEFAIILPGTKDEHVYLPVDSKFPYEDYAIIQSGESREAVANARKSLRQNLLKYAKDVNEKYIDVPNTTDFAVIFLPLEGLYLEALNMGLFEEIQNKYKINLTGPTTFTAFINSLNMGFRSLLIQKKSADVFKLLGAVKTEFGKFAQCLEKTKKKVDAAADELNTLVDTRTRAINKKLNSIEALDEETTKAILGSDTEKAEEEV